MKVSKNFRVIKNILYIYIWENLNNLKEILRKLFRISFFLLMTNFRSVCMISKK